MTTANMDLYRALREAGASEELAAKASETVGSYDRHFARLDGRLNTLTWMISTHLGLTTLLLGGVIWKLVDLSEKVARLTEAVARITT